MRYDLVVIGAGPAGALAARQAARRGASVLLLDRATFPRPKVCGACLSAGAVELLDAVGLGGLPASLGARPLHTLVLSAGTRRARVSLEGGCAVSRPVLDQALVDEARAEGVEFWSGARATIGEALRDVRTVSVVRAGDHLDVEASAVIDASGLGSGVGPRGTTYRIHRASRIGLGATLAGSPVGVGAGELHMVVGRTGYVGMVEVESGALNVAAAVDPGALGGIGPAAAVADIVGSASVDLPIPFATVPWKGTPALTRSAADVGDARLLRVGDAAGYVEPFTGEGMCWALDGAVAGAELALAGLDTWDGRVLDAWRAYHRGALRRAKGLCRLTAAALRRDWLVRGAVAALEVAPHLAAPFVRRAARPPRAGAPQAA